MSDAEPALPGYLIEAIMSEGPPPEAVDLVKNAFTWRTVDAELMMLSFDSAGDKAGVRDASARRTIEFTLADMSVIIEVDGRTITGRLTPAREGTVSLTGLGSDESVPVDSGSFRFVNCPRGAASLRFDFGDSQVQTPAFAIG